MKCQTPNCNLNKLTHLHGRDLCSIHYRQDLAHLYAKTQEARNAYNARPQLELQLPTIGEIFATLCIITFIGVMAYAIAP